MSKVTKYISPYLSIPDQEGVGFCVSNAFSTMMEIFEMNKRGTEDVPELSRLFLQSECKAMDGVSNSQGTYYHTACNVLKNKGICTEKLLPYLITDDVRNLKFPKRTNEMHQAAKEYRIKRHDTTKGVDKIKEHVLKYGACVMENYFHHEKYHKNVLVEIGRKSQGIHATCIIGFDDEFEYKGYKGAFVRLNADNPKLQYGYGVEIIPYKHLENKWFIHAILCMPTNTTNYLESRYIGKGIVLPTDTVEMQIGSNKAYINGILKEVTPPPYIDNSTTLVPLRFVNDCFRKVDTIYTSKNNPIIVSAQEGDYYFKIGDTNVKNGYGEVIYTMPTPPKLVNGVTMMPIRAFSEVLGSKVEYNPKTKEIKIVR